ncbi:MAG: protein translocase subunit SecF [Nevskiales bacterium]
MRFFKKRTTIDFVGLGRITGIISLLLVVVSVACIMLRGFNFGIDFTGGLLAEVNYPATIELDAVRSALAKGGYQDSVVQYYGTSSDVLVRLPPDVNLKVNDARNPLLIALQAAEPGVKLRRIEYVGPQVGRELAENGAMALLFTLIGILVYIMFRFEWKFAVGSVAAVAHNVILTLGVFSALHIEFDLTVLAAILAVIGYSINDTIVVFDRIRENFHLLRKHTVNEIVNISHNQTLARTLTTGVTVFMVLFALLFLGGEVIRGFCLAMIVGIAVGTYASIFVAGSIALELGLKREDLMPPKREESDRLV